MWSFSRAIPCGLAPWILVLGAQSDTQDAHWWSRLTNGNFEQAGQGLAAMPAGTSFDELGPHRWDLLRLDLPATRRVQRGLRKAGGSQKKLVAFLADLIQAQRGFPLALLPRIEAYLQDDQGRTAVLPYLGRGALQLCRSGRKKGADILERILDAYPKADWALSNLANGYRFLGHYDQAVTIFERLLGEHGRQAWFLNGLALVHQARFEYEEALALYLEGAREDSAGNRADKFTCRTNAAILLIARKTKEDLARAEQLLDSVVSQDPEAIRAPYHLRRIQRIRKSAPQ